MAWRRWGRWLRHERIHRSRAPFLDQLAAQGWTVIDQGGGIPQEAAPSLRRHFREWLLPQVFDEAVHAINRTDDGREWLTPRQLEDLRSALLRQPNRSLLEANEAVQTLREGLHHCAMAQSACARRAR